MSTPDNRPRASATRGPASTPSPDARHRAVDRWRRLATAAVAALLMTGCIFQTVKTQQARIDALCRVTGTAATEHRGTDPIIVGLLRHRGGDLGTRENWELFDHYVLEGSDRWIFAVTPDTYRLVAFEDTNGDGKLQPDEPFLRLDPDRPVICTAGQTHRDIALVIPTAGRSGLRETVDVAALQARTIHTQAHASMGLLSAVGEVVSLDDDRFSEEHARNGLWRPFDFLFDARPGLYFLEPFDPGKTPVLFVHGITGSPRDFRHLIARLDRRRFQPWVYYYPSGVHLGAVADHLTQTMRQLQLEHGFQRCLVVAHSMGGLVSRGFLLRHQTAASRVQIPLYVTLATPWGGHRAAESGVRRAPVVVRVWYDMAPDSEYLRRLFFKDPETRREHRPLPAGTAHHLLFSFQRNRASFGESDDHTVSVASQMFAGAQRDAVRLYGFDQTHTGILGTVEASELLNELLAKAAGG